MGIVFRIHTDHVFQQLLRKKDVILTGIEDDGIGMAARQKGMQIHHITIEQYRILSDIKRCLIHCLTVRKHRQILLILSSSSCRVFSSPSWLKGSLLWFSRLWSASGALIFVSLHLLMRVLYHLP